MADVDFVINQDDGYTVSLISSANSVYGNRALMNRFQVTFLSNTRAFLNVDGAVESDEFGGDAQRFLGVPIAVSNSSAISAALLNAIESTVSSLKSNEPSGVPNTERIDTASLESLSVEGDVVKANISVVPIETELFSSLIFSVPIRGV